MHPTAGLHKVELVVQHPSTEAKLLDGTIDSMHMTPLPPPKSKRATQADAPHTPQQPLQCTAYSYNLTHAAADEVQVTGTAQHTAMTSCTAHTLW
jgi:hypothetical protein